MRAMTVLPLLVCLLLSLLCKPVAGDGASYDDTCHRAIYRHESLICERRDSVLSLLQTNAKSLVLPVVVSLDDDESHDSQDYLHAPERVAELPPSESNAVWGSGEDAAPQTVDAGTPNTKRFSSDVTDEAAALPGTIPPTAMSRWRALTDLVAGAARSVEALKTSSGSSALESLIVVLLFLLGCIMLGCCFAMLNMDLERVRSEKGHFERDIRARRQSEDMAGPQEGGAQQRFVTKQVPTSLVGRFSPYGASRNPGTAMRSPQPDSRQPVPFSPGTPKVPPPPLPPLPPPQYPPFPPPQLPPPLCPFLLLPHCEAWFAVAFENLTKGSGTLDFVGLSGKPLLRAVVETLPGGTRGIRVSMSNANSPTLASVNLAPGGVMELKGAGGKPYGNLRRGTVPSYYGLFAEGGGGPEMLSLDFDPHTSQLILYSQGGQNPIAWAARCSANDFFASVEHLELRVGPGVDSVLVLCCVLGAVLFGGAALPPTGRPAGDSPRSSMGYSAR